MRKFYIIKASNGIEVIDDRPEAEIKLAAMESREEMFYKRKHMEKINRKMRNPLYKVACICGII